MASTLTQWCAHTAGLLEALQSHMRTATETKAQERVREEEIAAQKSTINRKKKLRGELS